MERITRFRAIAMLLAFAIILGLFSVRLYSIQLQGGGSVDSLEDVATLSNKSTGA